MTCMHSTETVFTGSVTRLIGLVIREGVASFMWAVFACIARYFLRAVF